MPTRLGIAPRLSIAFLAVALLAVAANAINEHGTSFIGTIDAAAPVAPAELERGNPDALSVALDQYQRAVVARLEADDPARSTAYRQAAAALAPAGKAYATALADTIDETVLRNITRQLEEHRRAADTLLRSAGTRPRLLQEYHAELDALDARLKASLDHTWKVFGRVVARQYLVDASRVLDEMRRHAASLALPQGYDETTLSAVAAREEALAVIFRENERGIARGLGKDWLAAARGELGQLVALRQSLVHDDREREAGIEAFSKNYGGLAAGLRRTTALFTAATAVATERRQSADAQYAQSARDERQRLLLRWLSGCVLLLLLAISVNTVVSVVMPVRRLLRATRRIAQGETGVSVPRGGIRELDTLAVSFNHMAEELAAAQALARQYHGQLEAKVEERTRQLQHLAEHDPLTRLPNRRQLFTQLNAALARAAQSKSLVGVLFIDLDHFKHINDSMGHVFGDRVLQTIAERLSRAAADFGFSARLGGDEFTVVYERASHIDEIRDAGARLVRAFQDPLIVDGRELLMGLSVGASVYPEHANDAEALLRAADAALFQAKAEGRSQLRLFSADLLEIAASRFATEQGLRHAVERGEFELFFQPEVSLATLETGLVEALLRWRPPDGTCVLPKDFLQVAEDCGLIREIGDWVLESAVGHAAQWHYSSWRNVRVAVNVSSRQLLDNHFVGRVRGLLAQHELPSECIEIELTENVLQTGHQTIEALRQLRALGVGVALDDFGTGYSSLVSLEQLPLSRVKLDRNLVASIDSSARSQAIARAIIALCQSLNLQITAEGIERREQLAWLNAQAPMYVQGYLVSPPLPAPELIRAITRMPERMSSLLQPAIAPELTGQFRQLRRVR